MQVFEFQLFLLLNMSDVASEQGKTINYSAISEKLNIPVVLFSAQDRKNYDSFYYALEKTIEKKSILNTSSLEAKYEENENYKTIKALIPENVIPGYSSIWLAIKAVEEDAPVIAKITEALIGEKRKSFIDTVSKIQKGMLLSGEIKFNWIDEILKGNVVSEAKTRELGKFDRMITHRIWGKPVVVLTILFGLIGSFIPALPFMGLGAAVGALANPISAGLTSIGQCSG